MTFPFKTSQLENYIPVTESGCWLWIGVADKNGYGRIRVVIDGVSCLRYAHRAQWIANFGPIPDGMFICHKCDTPSCINPAHLWLGTNDENMRDMVAKGRATDNRNRWRKSA